VTTKFVRLTTGIPGPASRELMARKERAVADAFAVHVPVAVREARGALLTDVDGNVLIDLAGGVGCMNVGHSHPRVVRAIQESAARFTHTDFSVVMYESYIRLAERLAALAPGPFPKKAAFFNSGAEAVENAIKIARCYTGRPAVIALEGAFHGRTAMALALTSKVRPYKKGLGPLAQEVYRVPAPYLYRRPEGMGEEEYIRFCADALERAFVTMVSPDDCAAIILEPVQGEGGFVPLPAAYLQRVQEIARRHGVLLIADEVQTGCGRTGTFFASEQLGIEPDLICAGKSLAAGLPLSAVIGRQEVMDAPGPGAIGGTYVGNPVACDAAHAVLDILEEERLLDRARELGALFRRRFADLGERLAALPGARFQVGDVRGLGAMVGAEFVVSRATREPFDVAPILRRAAQSGLVLVKCGIYGNVIRLLPPLVISDPEVHEAFDLLEAACVAEAVGG